MDTPLEKSGAMLMTNISGLGCPIVAETEGFIIALQEQDVSTNVSIYHLPVSPSCHLCHSHDETVNHLLQGWCNWDLEILCVHVCVRACVHACMRVCD